MTVVLRRGYEKHEAACLCVTVYIFKVLTKNIDKSISKCLSRCFKQKMVKTDLFLSNNVYKHTMNSIFPSVLHF